MRFMYSIKIILFIIFFFFISPNGILAADARFSWIPNQESGVLGYNVYYGLSSRSYLDAIEITASSITLINGRMYSMLSGLEDNQTYYIALTAFNEAAESDYSSEITVHTTPSTLIPQDNWRLHYVDSEELIAEDGAAVNAFDGDASTIWHTEWKYSDPPPPHEIQIDLGEAYALDGFRYLPRQAGGVNGTMKEYAFYVSSDGINWGAPVAQDFLPSDLTEKEIRFATATGRFVRLVALSEINNEVYTSAAEIHLLGELYSESSPPQRIPQSNWSLHYVDSEELIAEDGAAVNAFDGDASSIWHTEWKYSDPPPPHEIQIDLGGMYEIHGIDYLPRQNGSNGIITQYEIYVSDDGMNWGTAVASGNLDATNTEKHIVCTPKFGQFIALVAKKSADGNPWTSVAEINVTGR